MSEPDTARSGAGDDSPGSTALAGALTKMLRRALLNRLDAIRHGHLTLVDALGTRHAGTPPDAGGPQAVLRVRDLSAYGDVARGGTLGAAEAYLKGKWTASDLTALVRIFVANRQVMDSLDRGLSRLGAPVRRLGHWLHRNTRAQSRRNIHAHYDLGNEFYRLFLDPTMMYSAAVYPREDSTLEEAALHKLDLICRRLQLGPQDHLLEIGTGWGGLAIHAAGRYGCRVTTTTISGKQRELARQRVREHGLEERVTVLDRDYRDLDGQFDKLVSVEMIEAVGLDYLEEYFRVCSARLKPHGRMLLQAIVIADQLFESARRSVDFIQKYIFPGGALPSLGVIQSAVARVSDFRLVHVHDIGMDYARTLREWRRRFLAQLNAVRQLGFSEEFIRMWEYYLAYCEGGFLERAISDVQIVFDKPGAGTTEEKVPELSF
jgi:cyclopropane-fatty-acyl-phospholipid synthase